MLPRSVVSLVLLSLLSLPLLNAQEKKEGKAGAAGRLVNSTSDTNGNQHPGVSAIHANGTITCTRADQSVNQGQVPKCYVVTNSGTSALEKGQNMGTGSGGTMTLTCNGQGALACQVRIDD